MSLPGPSIVAVKLGASLTSREIDLVTGRRWNCGVVNDCDESTHPLKPRVADMFVLASNSSSVTFISQFPSFPTTPERLVTPSTEEVKLSHTSISKRSVPDVILFSNRSLPLSVVVAPAPRIGWSTARGLSCVKLASSVRFTKTPTSIPSFETYPL